MINIGCLSIFHFGCSVKVTKDQDGVIYQIFTVVDINQKEIIKFDKKNKSILSLKFPNMKKDFQDDIATMKRIRNNKNSSSDALTQKVNCKYK